MLLHIQTQFNNGFSTNNIPAATAISNKVKNLLVYRAPVWKSLWCHVSSTFGVTNNRLTIYVWLTYSLSPSHHQIHNIPLDTILYIFYTFRPHVQPRSQASSEEIQWIYALSDCIYNTLLRAAWHKDYLSSGYSLLGWIDCLWQFTLLNRCKSRLYGRNPNLMIKSRIGSILHQHLYP